MRYCLPTLLENGANMDETYITILDADSLVPSMYIEEVNKHISENLNNRHRFVYQPPQIFTRNEKECSFFVRLTDIMMSFLQTSNLVSTFNYTLAVSNYTISYRNLENIGFFDTCIFSRTEDIRTTSKSFWKNNGEI